MRRIITSLLLLIHPATLWAGSQTLIKGDVLQASTSGRIGTTGTPNSSSVLDLVSTSKGFYPPRMTTTQRDAISSPADGLRVANTTTHTIDWYNGSAWRQVASLTDITTASTSTNASFYPLFVASSSNSVQAFNLGTGLTFNPSTNTLATTTFSGAVTGHSSLDLAIANNLSDVNSSSTSFNNISGLTTLGDLIYGGASGTRSRLAGNTTTTVQLLSQTGDGANSAAPVWLSAVSTNTAGKVVLRDGSGNFSAGTVTATVTGTASGNTTYTANNHGVVVSGAANAMTVIAPDASTSKVLVSGGSSADPAWGTVAIGGGGTGQTTKSAAFDALSPMSASGDITYGGTAGTGTRLAKGSDGNILTLASGLPSWASPSAATVYAWFGNHSNNCLWSTTTDTTYKDPGTDATCTFTSTSSTNFGTPTSYVSGGNNLPGVVVTIPVTGIYHVCALTEGFVNTASHYCSYHLWDGTTVIAETEKYNENGTAPIPLCGLYAGTAGSTTFSIQSKADASVTCSIGGDGTNAYTIMWSIYKVN